MALDLNGFKPIGIRGILAATGLTKNSNFMENNHMLAAGIIGIKKGGNTFRVASEIISKIEDHYPVTAGRKNMAVACIEGTEGKNLRGSHIVGDADDIIKFWNLCKKQNFHDQKTQDGIKIRNINIERQAFCWTAMVKSHYYVPYIDLDEYGAEHDLTKILSTRCVPTINLVLHELQKKQPSTNAVVLYNTRASERIGLWKHSFHIHFTNVVFANINDFKSLLQGITGMPRAKTWIGQVDGSFLAVDDAHKPIYDTVVYGGRNQLFRGPFCGKNQNGDTVLRHLIWKNSGDDWKTGFDEMPDADVISAARIVVPLSDSHVIYPTSVSSTTGAALKTIKLIDAPAPLPNQPDNRGDLVFFGPIIHHQLIPAWQEFRRNLMQKIGANGCAVPEDVHVMKHVSNASKKHQRFVTVAGDSFCMTDTKYYHSKSPGVVTIGIDMHTCEIWQHCFACAKSGTKYQFLTENNKICIHEVKEYASSSDFFSFPVGAPPNYQFFLDYYPDSFCMCHQTDTLYVYDDDQRVWKSGVSANVMANTLLTRLNNLYAKYVDTRTTRIRDKEIAAWNRANQDMEPQEIKKAHDKISHRAKDFVLKNLTLIRNTNRKTLTDELKTYLFKRAELRMNKFPHLIPMNDGNCYNVFTSESTMIKRDHYFTGVCNARMTQDTEEITAISEWFDEISTGEVEKAKYLKTIAGYMMTFLTHDRKFYTLQGTGKNGKGLFKQFLLNILRGDGDAEARCKSLNQSYWERSANRTNGPESASPETYMIIDKSLLYTDDIDRVPIDSAKLKRVVACEPMSGRPLYGKPVVIEPVGKVLWTTNHNVDLPGGDNAIWERHSPVEFLTKYVEASDVHGKFHLLQNEKRRDELLAMKDAFFTIAMKTLTSVYQMREYNADNTEPLVMGPFVVPESTRRAVSDARARQLPLAAFMAKHTEPTKNPLDFILVDDAFNQYIAFLNNQNERRLASTTTHSEFTHQLATALEIICGAKHVLGRKLTGPPIEFRKKQKGFFFVLFAYFRLIFLHLHSARMAQ